MPNKFHMDPKQHDSPPPPPPSTPGMRVPDPKFVPMTEEPKKGRGGS